MRPSLCIPGDGNVQASMLLQLTSISCQRAAFGNCPSAFCRSFEDMPMHDALWEMHHGLQRDRQGNTDDRKEERKEDKLREVVKDVEDLLHISQPVALHWRDQGSAFMLVLQDFTVIHCTLNGAEVGGLHIDRSVATLAPDRLLAVAVDVMSQLLVASTKNGNLLLYDARRFKAKFGTEGTRFSEAKTSSSITLRYPAPFIDINCSSDLVLAISHDRLTLLHMAASSKSGSKGARSMTVGWEEVISCLPGSSPGTEVVTARFSSHLPHVILIVFRLEPNHGATSRSHCYSAAKLDYSRGKKELVLSTCSKIPDCPAPITSMDWSRREDQVLVGTKDGTVLLHDLQRGTLRSVRLSGKGEVSRLSWHPSSAVALLAFGNGEVFLFDSALQQLNLATDTAQAAANIPLSTLHGFHCHVELLRWAMAAPAVDAVGGGSGAGSMPAAYECAALVMDRGPAVLLHLALGALSRGKLRPREVVAQHLAQGGPHRALALIEVCPDPLERYHCLLLMLPSLLRRHSPASQEVLEAVFEIVWSSLLSGMDIRQREALHGLLRRYGHQLLRQGAFEHAFSVAARAQDKGLLEDILSWALHCEEARLATAVQSALTKLRVSGGGVGGDHGPIKEAPLSPEDAAMLGAPTVEELASLRQLQTEVPALEVLLQKPQGEWADLLPEEVVALGLYLETEVRHSDARKLYELHGAQGALQRLDAVASSQYQ